MISTNLTRRPWQDLNRRPSPDLAQGRCRANASGAVGIVAYLQVQDGIDVAVVAHHHVCVRQFAADGQVSCDWRGCRPCPTTFALTGAWLDGLNGERCLPPTVTPVTC
jgi:hypothetical protein